MHSNQLAAPGRRRRKSATRQRRANRDGAPPEFRFFIDQHGRQHFNFKQQRWLTASVEMAFTRVYSTALKTLAANMLALYGIPGRSAVLLAPAFCRECLMGAPDRAWALPMATIEAWLDSKKRRRTPRTHARRQRRAALSR
jgi:hypothetical protein